MDGAGLLGGSSPAAPGRGTYDFRSTYSGENDKKGAEGDGVGISFGEKPGSAVGLVVASSRYTREYTGADGGISTLLLVGCYSSFATMYMLVSFVAPFFPAYATGIGLTPAQIGFVCSADAIGEVLSTSIATLVMAKMGCARAAVAGMVGNAVSSLIFGMLPLVTHEPAFLFPTFAAMRLCNGAATNITYIAVMAVLCNLMPDKTGQVASNCAVLTTLGLTGGPPFGGVLISVGRWLSTDPDRVFATPFIGCTLVLLAPTLVLWAARHDVDAAEAVADGREDDDEEEEEISFSEEMRRMKSVLNRTTLACVVAVIVTSIGQDARDPILGPHLSSRCDDSDVILGEHFPFDYDELQISLIFSSGSLAFLPLSMYIGAQADLRGRDFAWLRRAMALGLALQVVAFVLMGPAKSLLPLVLVRQLETGASMVLAQNVLGVSNALTLIAAFPFIEGVCEMSSSSAANAEAQSGKPKAKVLSQSQRMAVAGTLYNAAFSGGCAMGPLITGALSVYLTFSDTLLCLACISIFAMLTVILEGSTNDGACGGFVGNTDFLIKQQKWIEIGEKFEAAMAEEARTREAAGKRQSVARAAGMRSGLLSMRTSVFGGGGVVRPSDLKSVRSTRAAARVVGVSTMRHSHHAGVGNGGGHEPDFGSMRWGGPNASSRYGSRWAGSGMMTSRTAAAAAAAANGSGALAIAPARKFGRVSQAAVAGSSVGMAPDTDEFGDVIDLDEIDEEVEDDEEQEVASTSSQQTENPFRMQEQKQEVAAEEEEEEEEGEAEELSLLYKAMLWLTFIVLAVLIAATISQASTKDQCLPFYADKMPAQNRRCENPLTIGLFTDALSLKNCGAKVHTSSASTAGGENQSLPLYYPVYSNGGGAVGGAPAITGCVLVRNGSQATCYLGGESVSTATTTCLC